MQRETIILINTRKIEIELVKIKYVKNPYNLQSEKKRVK